MNHISGDHGDRSQNDRLQRTKDRKELTPVAVKTVATLFDLWSLPQRKAAKLMNVDEATWAAMDEGSWKGILSAEQLERTSAFVAIYRSLTEIFGETNGESWPTANNRLDPFQGKPPVDFMAIGDINEIQAVRRHLKVVQEAAGM
ncbi:antitoxin Xre-like helix-turn-helix domain-containing protein [Nisaea sp.]|uniref:antitoxin Xre-like helix-turn-helix domain-containing protein n=1 Tax=Nisaea sp. TaxID=2024842 RepID=UPI002B26AF60|nr:antitoxin Xre-like helix-turn-helix domain-containing protein [Nisaea sp.]